MTKSELFAEPAGPRLDAWVAEFVMGWRRAGQADQWPFSHAQWNTDEGPTGWHIRVSPNPCKSDCDVWQPSVDIRAAWIAAAHANAQFEIFAGDLDAPLAICKHVLGLRLAGHDSLSGEEN